MSSFTRFDTSLKLEYLLGYKTNYWKLLEGFTFYSDRLNKGKRIYVTVPTGFITDGASVPRIFWSWIPPLGDYGQAAVLHDYLRRICVYKLEGSDVEYLATTKEADKLFLEAMEILKVSKFKRKVMYLAVRAYTLLIGK